MIEAERAHKGVGKRKQTRVDRPVESPLVAEDISPKATDSWGPWRTRSSLSKDEAPGGLAFLQEPRIGEGGSKRSTTPSAKRARPPVPEPDTLFQRTFPERQRRAKAKVKVQFEATAPS